MNDLRCTELKPEHLDDYLKFFDTRAFTDNPRWASCYCYFPLHDPDKMDWKARIGSENKAAVSGCIASGQARGVLAYQGTEVIGWCNAGPWSMYPMLAEDAEPDAATLGVIFCFVVAPEARGQGVAAALLDEACDNLRRQGMRHAMARPAKQADSPAANHLGPLSLYLKAGFEVMRETDDGEVYVRKVLG